MSNRPPPDEPMGPTEASRVMLIVYGEPCSKANSRRIFQNRRTGKPFSAKSAKACVMVESYVAQLKDLWRGGPPLTGALCLTADLFYASRRPDLDESLVMDALQRARVIQNDRQIVRKRIRKQLDKVRPRTELWLEESQEI